MNRRVEIFRDGEWCKIEFKDLKKGDRFRMFEPDDGSQVEDGKGNKEFIATSDAYLKEKIMTVDIT